MIIFRRRKTYNKSEGLHGNINVLPKDKNIIRSRMHRLYAPQKESCFALQ